jgi:hypothetical protein
VARVVELEPPICDYCGCYIEDEDAPCRVLEDGRCQP